MPRSPSGPGTWLLRLYFKRTYRDTKCMKYVARPRYASLLEILDHN